MNITNKYHKNICGSISIQHLLLFIHLLANINLTYDSNICFQIRRNYIILPNVRYAHLLHTFHRYFILGTSQRNIIINKYMYNFSVAEISKMFLAI